ncbi:hypothetical protein GGF32_000468 [Allomyces javanicus]|nr:hypothetical protein GGF32_000468 [Allomyces javanicus]
MSATTAFFAAAAHATASSSTTSTAAPPAARPDAAPAPAPAHAPANRADPPADPATEGLTHLQSTLNLVNEIRLVVQSLRTSTASDPAVVLARDSLRSLRTTCREKAARLVSLCNVLDHRGDGASMDVVDDARGAELSQLRQTWTSNSEKVRTLHAEIMAFREMLHVLVASAGVAVAPTAL